MPSGVYKHSKNTREQNLKISRSLIGNKRSLGKKLPPLSDEQRKKRSEIRKGNKTNLWKGGVSSINLIIRSSIEYRLWRESVFKRDNWTCVWCGQRGGKLNADHIKPFCDYPELRFAIDNGRTLCLECHKKTPTFGKKRQASRNFAY